MASETVHQPDSPTDPTNQPVHVAGGRGEEVGDDADVVGSQNDNASSVDHVDDKQPPAPVLTKKEKLRRHCGRFWWWYLIVGAILLIILLPLLFKVIIPAIIQNVVSGQKLPVTSGTLRALSPNTISVQLNTSLDTPLAVHLDPMDLALYNKDTETYSPFLSLHLDGQGVNHKTDVYVQPQTVTVENHTELVSWFNDVFDLPTAKLSVKASPTVHLSSLKYHPDLKKTIDVPALNYLKGFGVDDLEFVLPAKEDGTNMQGHLNLPNSGALTLGLGNLTFNMMSGDVKLGLVNVYDVDLYPGDNSRRFDGIFYFSELVPNLSGILDAQKGALANGVVEFNATGNATVVNGQHIPYLEEVLKNKHLTFTIPVVTLLGDVVSGLLNDKTDLMNMFGEVFGNTTLLENALDRFEHDGGLNSTIGSSSKAKPKMKRMAPGGSLMTNLLKLGLRTRKR